MALPSDPNPAAGPWHDGKAAMQSDREQLAVYVMLGRAHVAAELYDPRGAFILLHSITDGMGEETPEIVDAASHLHVIAALGAGKPALEDARASMARVVATLELRLLASAAA